MRGWNSLTFISAADPYQGCNSMTSLPAWTAGSVAIGSSLEKRHHAASHAVFVGARFGSKHLVENLVFLAPQRGSGNGEHYYGQSDRDRSHRYSFPWSEMNAQEFSPNEGARFSCAAGVRARADRIGFLAMQSTITPA